jgi:hypothetical protein
LGGLALGNRIELVGAMAERNPMIIHGDGIPEDFKVACIVKWDGRRVSCFGRISFFNEATISIYNNALPRLESEFGFHEVTFTVPLSAVVADKSGRATWRCDEVLDVDSKVAGTS